MTQTDRVLALLRARGPQGVSALDFALPGVADGQAPIMRVAARILELRRQGHRITDGGQDGAVKRYVLQDAPTASEGPSRDDEAGRLFETPYRPRSAFWDAA